jgi:hypothetical protein
MKDAAASLRSKHLLLKQGSGCGSHDSLKPNWTFCSAKTLLLIRPDKNGGILEHRGIECFQEVYNGGL